MAQMNTPSSSAVVTVRDADVDRYRAAGWTDVQSEPKKSTGSRSSSKK